MGPDNVQFTPEPKNPLLEEINILLQGLGNNKGCAEVPERIEGTEVLKGKAILMLDDDVDVLESFIPHLVVATEGNARFIRYTSQNLEALTGQISDPKPDIILLDYNLSPVLTGDAVTEYLIANGIDSLIIGFSTAGLTLSRQVFQGAGAFDAINKNPFSPQDSIKELANLIAAQESK